MLNKPVLEYLNKDGIEKIHETAVEILSRFGVNIEDKAVVNLFLEHGCEIKNDRVVIPADLIGKMIENNKSHKITLYGPTDISTTIEPGSFKTHGPGGMPSIVDRETGMSRYATERDFIESMYVMNNVDQLDIPCALVTPYDIPAKINQLRQTELMFKYSEKPIYGPGISSATEVDYIVEMYNVCSDGKTIEHPRGMVGVSPESPLHIPKEISHIYKTVITAGIPTSILAAPTPGLSSPYTIAGSMAQVHAEIMATAVMSYLFNPETPTFYGSRVTFTDMRTSNATWGIPEMGICGGIAAQMARRINMVSDLYGTATSSCAFDEQSGFERSMNALLPILCGSEFISGFGTMASNLLTALEQLIIDNEFYEMLRKADSGVTVADDELGLDALEEVLEEGSGAGFITSEHSIEYLRSGEVFTPDMGFFGKIDDWEKRGKKTIDDIANERLKDMLDNVEIEMVIDPDKASELDKIVEHVDKNL